MLLRMGYDVKATRVPLGAQVRGKLVKIQESLTSPKKRSNTQNMR